MRKAGVGYYEAASNGEQSTTSSTWQTKVSLQFTLASADNHLILAFAENMSSDTKGYFGVCRQIDGTARRTCTGNALRRARGGRSWA